MVCAKVVPAPGELPVAPTPTVGFHPPAPIGTQPARASLDRVKLSAVVAETTHPNRQGAQCPRGQGTWSATGSVDNPTPAPHSYIVTVSLRDGTGVLGTARTSLTVAPGARVPWRVSAPLGSSVTVRCSTAPGG